MDVYENTVIYILTPAYITTGGPNSCHQLCYKLRRFKFNAYIVYYSPDEAVNYGDIPTTHPNYLWYNNPILQEIYDEPQNIVIMPETYAAAGKIYDITKARKAVWWLSVDFYYITVFGLLREIKELKFFDLLSSSDCYHFTDSEYAKKHLELFSIRKDRIMPLHSYLHPTYIQSALNKPKYEKKNYVTFNPSKGIEFTAQIHNFCQTNGYKQIVFVPLTGMSQEKLCSVYKLSKVHIDFGPFPGREYIPREAVINDCCIITGLRGASKYYEDVPIPDKYKFEDIPENLPLIAECIQSCLEGYETYIDDFCEYKQFALGLEKTFESQILSNFQTK